MRIALGILVVVCSLLPFSALFCPEAEAVNPTTTISLDQSSQTANVAPGQTGIVTFTGIVTCENEPGSQVQKVVVELTSDAGGWACSTTPMTLAFSASVTELTFSVSVQVPPLTDADIVQTLSVSGIARPTPGVMTYSVGPVEAVINVRQFYDFEINCTRPFQECARGDTATFSIRVLNKGNGVDTVRATLEDGLAEALDRGFTTQFNSTDVRIAKGAEGSFDLVISAPDKASDFAVNEVFKFEIKFVSQGSMSSMEPKTSTYVVYVRYKDMGESLVKDVGNALLYYVLPIVIVAAVIGSGIFLFIYIRRRRKRGRAKE